LLSQCAKRGKNVPLSYITAPIINTSNSLFDKVMQYEPPKKSAKSHLFRSALPIQEMISRAASGSCFSESSKVACRALPFVIVLKHKIPIIDDKSRKVGIYYPAGPTDSVEQP
jgi:hypothetical protein